MRRHAGVGYHVIDCVGTCCRTLNLLGLWDIRHSVIGDERVRGISGGQRKRVNIGMELVADPTVLFLGA